MNSLLPLRGLAQCAADSLRPLTVHSVALSPDQAALLAVMVDHVRRLHDEAMAIAPRPAGLLPDLKVAGYHLTQAQQRLEAGPVRRAHLVLAVDQLDRLVAALRQLAAPAIAVA